MSRKLVPAVISFVSIVALSVLAFSVAVPANCAAADSPVFVRGYIYDSEGRLVEGASVTVSMKDGETVISTKTDNSDSSGFYSTTFLAVEWDVGNTVYVIAEFSGNQQPNWTVAIDTEEIYVDVHFTFEIPEFGFDAGLLVAGLGIGAVAVGALVWRRK